MLATNLNAVMAWKGPKMERFGAPNFLSVIDGYERGKESSRRSRLAELDERGRQLQGEVLAGNQNKLAELYAVDPDRGMKVQQFTEQQKKDWLEDFSRQAYGADTEPKWRAMIDRYKAQGREFSPGEDDFINRDALIAGAMSVGDRLGLDLRREDAARSQANSDRSYNLQVRNFEADERYRAQQRADEQAKLAAAAPDLQEMYDPETGQPYKARWNPQTQAFDRVGGTKAPDGMQLEVGPDGSLSLSQGMGKITEGQGKEISYLNRMLTAAPILDKNDEALTSFGENVAGSAPLGLGNYAKSSQFQQAEQAGKNFLTALLRKESGAQIPPAEERSYGEIFLPRPGDKKEVIAQKREARRQAAIGIKMGLPANIIKGMIQQGVDFSTLDSDTAPASTPSAGKADMQPQSGKTRRGITFQVGQ